MKKLLANVMKTILSYTLLIGVSLLGSAKPSNAKDLSPNHNRQIKTMKGLMRRILPDYADKFTFRVIHADKDVFQLSSKDGRILVEGNNAVSMAMGLNWYLKYYCHTSISWNVRKLDLPNSLPRMKRKVRKPAVSSQRYYLNYCTFSYSMAFWGWKRWEREIDWMALHGVNLALAVVGQGAVWQQTLQKFGFTDKEIKSFLAGPGYTAWWLMGNLEGAGGPVRQRWIDAQAHLQKKIVKRMRAYGIKPVMQGFYGMVPSVLKKKYPHAHIIDTGKWINYRRPDMLMPDDSLFSRMAKAYYQTQQKLYGRAKYFGGDPFHEGSVPEGTDLSAMGTGIYRAMDRAHPGATWVLQGWAGNPKSGLIEDIAQGRLLILDLMAESRPQWKHRDFKGHDWIWNTIPNFGGNIGMYGRLSAYSNGLMEARHGPLGNQLKGIGAAPEGIGTNDVDYDLIFEMGWRSTSPDLKNWMQQYARTRYGKNISQVPKAWELLLETVYSCSADQEGTTESVFCARPKMQKYLKASSWGTTNIYYDPKKLQHAWKLLLTASDPLKQEPAYRYDVVNIGRQVLDGVGKKLYRKIYQAYRNHDKEAFADLSEQFLELIRDQDRLLSTQKSFLLGRWLQQAKDRATSSYERKLFEQNARSLITVWSEQRSALHDYANREWAGLLTDFYLPRWQMFFNNMQKRLNGKNPAKIDFHSWERRWTQETNMFRVVPRGNSVVVAKALYQKYVANINQ